jgi:serine/threonine protein kinase
VPSGIDQKRVIAERYALSSRLGSGGMGVVWKAHDKVLSRDVAVKEVSIPHEVPEKERSGLYTRAMREARAAARLGHPNTVTVFDVHEEDGRPYIVMEFVEGRTLQETVRKEGPFEPKVAAEMGLLLLDALERAHTRGIVHRDVKPGNVIVTDDGSVKLADFGIAAIKDDPRITQTGVVLGSPSYLSPEQAHGREASPATDLWSLGATLYFAVEGEAPFDKGNAIATVDAVVHDRPRAPRRADELGGAINRLLEKEPGDRPDHTEARGLLEHAAGRGASVFAETSSETQPLPPRASEPEPEPEQPVEYEPSEPREDTHERRLSPVLLWGAGLVVLLALAIAAAVLMWPDSSPTEPSSRSQGGEGVARAEDGSEGGGGSQEPDPGEYSAPAEGEEGTVPSDWTAFEEPSGAYTVAYPAGWTIDEGDGALSNTDFEDPESSAYMRVAWTSPPNPAGAKGAWEDYEPEFAAQHESEGYQLIGISDYDYRGYDAALWESTYGGVHAVNLGFVVGDYGYALNFVVPEELWNSYQDEFEAFKAGFQPAQ